MDLKSFGIRLQSVSSIFLIVVFSCWWNTTYNRYYYWCYLLHLTSEANFFPLSFLANKKKFFLKWEETINNYIQSSKWNKSSQTHKCSLAIHCLFSHFTSQNRINSRKINRILLLPMLFTFLFDFSYSRNAQMKTTIRDIQVNEKPHTQLTLRIFEEKNHRICCQLKSESKMNI